MSKLLNAKLLKAGAHEVYYNGNRYVILRRQDEKRPTWEVTIDDPKDGLCIDLRVPEGVHNRLRDALYALAEHLHAKA